ncbi:MAG: hypothetical protein O7E51_13200 [Acidobacteria bacterium]|nr:hypothetical protein [Acidobacteriota bacterium]
MKLPRPQLDGIVKRIFRTPPSEAVAIAKALEPEERAAARERKAHDGRPRKLPERRTGDTPDKVAAHTIQNRCAEIKLRAERKRTDCRGNGQLCHA